MFGCSIIFCLYYCSDIYDYIRFEGKAVAGWGSNNGICLAARKLYPFCLRYIGEYIGKIYTEVKHRPRYIIEEQIGLE